MIAVSRPALDAAGTSRRRAGLGLAGWLALTTALLVIGAVAIVSVAGVRLLRELAEAEALARVELAASAAREAVRQSGDDLLTATLVLSERPTLLRLLEDGGSGLDAYLQRYCAAADIDACAVQEGGALRGAVGEAVEWQHVEAAAAEQGQRMLVAGALPGVPLLGAYGELPGLGGTRILTVRRMDAAYAAQLSDSLGLAVELHDLPELTQAESPFTLLLGDALASGAIVTGEVPAAGVFASAVPVAGANGAVVALLRTSLPAEAALGPVLEMERRLAAIGVLVALLAAGSGVLIGRHWTRGIRELTAASRRIGLGDLTASVATDGTAEVRILASTMDEMRRNLVELTREIRTREAQAQAVLGGIVEGVFAVDRKRRIRYLNRQAAELLGTTESEAFGRFCGDVLRPEPGADGLSPCVSACPIVEAREAGTAAAVERIAPCDRRRRVVITSAAPSGEFQVQVLRDETELEAVRRTRDTVLANISHEFRTPLSAQLASIELLRSGLGTLPLDAQQNLVASLERGAQRLTWLIDNLLESVRIEAGQLSIRRQAVAIADVVADARELIEPLLALRGQRLEVQPLDSLPALSGDRQRLAQVLVNLLGNASKFAPGGSTIFIGGEARDDRVSFWVEDEGPGPANPDDTALFDQFHRSGGEDPEESGLGLGLFIVRSIVERHGGHVSLGRTPEGRTRARVELKAGAAA